MNLPRQRFSRIVVLCTILTAFLIGLALARKGYTGAVEYSLLSVFVWFMFRNVRIIGLAALCFCLLNLGLVRGATVQQNLAQYEQFVGQKVQIEGRIFDDPRYGYRGQTEFLLSDVRVEDAELRGVVRVRTYQSIGLQRGDTIRVEGKLRDGFGNYQASVSYASVEPIARSASPIESIRRQYFAGVYSSIPEPQASLGLGFLVGLRALLPPDLLDQLSITGLTHIVAVSGYNLTVIIRLAKRWFHRYSRFIALAMSLSLMAVFLLVTGGAASIVRASVVATTALLGWYFGRNIHPLVLLLLSAAVTAGINPLFLWVDLGWWLSFLAFFGVLIVAPVIKQKLLRKEELGLVGSTLLETTSAQLMALPLIVAVFGEFSVVSLLANVLILPLIPIAMLLTFLAGSAGVLAPALSGWIAWPAVRLLSFMTNTIQLLAAIPGASGEVQISSTFMYVFYGWIGSMLVIAARRGALTRSDLL